MFLHVRTCKNMYGARTPTGRDLKWALTPTSHGSSHQDVERASRLDA
jgi:hypothetical protein